MFDAALSFRVTESLFARQSLITGGNLAENSSSSVASVATHYPACNLRFLLPFGRGVHEKETSIPILKALARTCRSTNAEGGAGV
jgi:hypothetical protein